MSVWLTSSQIPDTSSPESTYWQLKPVEWFLPRASQLELALS